MTPLTTIPVCRQDDEDLVPREANPGFLVRAMEDNPVIHAFYESLVSIDGRARPGRSSKDNAVRVTRLLFQVDPEVKRLWKSKYVKRIRQVFFEGNQKLQKPHPVPVIHTTDFLAEEIIRLKGNSNPKTCCIHMKHLISISLLLKCYSVVVFS